MRKLLPHPLLSLALVGIWLLLNQPSLGHLLLGTAIAVVAGRAMAALEPTRRRVRNPLAILKLFGVVFVDIVRSNIAVAHLIMTSGRHGKRHSAFVEIPLQLRDPLPLAVLSMIVTATPGTAWLEYDSETGVLLLHVFDMIDSDDWRSIIRDRYEAHLLEIFP